MSPGGKAVGRPGTRVSAGPQGGPVMDAVGRARSAEQGGRAVHAEELGTGLRTPVRGGLGAAASVTVEVEVFSQAAAVRAPWRAGLPEVGAVATRRQWAVTAGSRLAELRWMPDG